MGILNRFTLVLAVATCLPASAQTVTLDLNPNCIQCELRFDLIRQIGGAGDPASPGPTAEAAAATDGSVFLSSPTMGGTIFVFDEQGRFQATLGRPGQGPGEFGLAPLLRMSRGDTLAAFDRGNSRLSLWSGSGDLVGETPLRGRVMSALPLETGEFLIAGLLQEGERFFALQIVRRDGSVVRSFGPLVDTSAPPQTMIRTITAGPDGSLFSAPMSGGLIENWDIDGTLIGRIDLGDPDLVRPPPLRIDFSSGNVPSQVSDISVDSAGRVWLFIARPEQDIGEISRDNPVSPEDLYDTEIMVIDTELARVVTSARFDGIVRPLHGGDLAYDLVDLASGDRKIRLGRLVLADGGSGPAR